MTWFGFTKLGNQIPQRHSTHMSDSWNRVFSNPEIPKTMDKSRSPIRNVKMTKNLIRNQNSNPD